MSDGLSSASEREIDIQPLITKLGSFFVRLCHKANLYYEMPDPHNSKR